MANESRRSLLAVFAMGNTWIIVFDFVIHAYEVARRGRGFHRFDKNKLRQGFTIARYRS